MSLPLNNAQADAAVPVAGNPDRTLTNQFFKDLIASLALKQDVSGLVTAINAALGNTTWQSGGSGTPTFGSLTGAVADNAPLVAALLLKADAANAALTGVPTAPTAAPGTNTTQIATMAAVKAAIDALLTGAPGALDTLDELAAALGDDANFATTITNALALKASLVQLNAGLHIDASYLTANAMVALQIDTTKALNTKTISADTIFTFSGAPAQANTYFGLILTNSSGADRTITIPSSMSEAQGVAITTFVIPANKTIDIVWRYDGTAYILKGEPVREPFFFTFPFTGTSTARDYRVLTNRGTRTMVITNVTSVCVSGTATGVSKIDGVALGGTANAVAAAEQSQAHAATNELPVGGDLAIGMTAGAVDFAITYSGHYKS